MIDGKLHVKASDGQDAGVFSLRDRQFTFAPGAAVSIQASLGTPRRGEVRVGVAIDGIRVGARPTKAGIELFAIDRGDDRQIDAIARVTGEGDRVTLTVVRDATHSDVLKWFATIGDQPCAGTITATAVPADAAMEIFVAAPRQAMKQPLWVSDLRVRPATDE